VSEWKVVRTGERLEIVALVNGREVGKMRAGLCGYEADGKGRFALTYLEVKHRWRGRGIGEALLRKVRELMPAGAERLYFMQVTSRGCMRLIEWVYGPVVPESGTREIMAASLPDTMDLRTLRRSRGRNAHVLLQGAT